MNNLKIVSVYAMLSVAPALVYAQGKITGQVTNKSNEPILGASIIVEGGTTGTTTDKSGKFELNANKGVLIVSYIGYKTQRIPLDGTTNLKIQLDNDDHVLEDVVVVGYGTQRKATLTGSISEVKGKDLVKSPQPNLSNSLAGRFSGVVINNRSGEPGYDGSSITVRGQATTGNNDVLVVVDGVPGQVGGLERLDPNDIESISVLKDASAAIYGNRAANGVILVTTKKGKSGKPSISYSGNLGLSSPTRLPKMADAATYALLRNEIAQGTNEAGGMNQIYSEDQIKWFKDGSNPLLYPNTNWADITLKNTALQSQHNLSVSGGKEDVRYFMSLGSVYQDGLFKEGVTKYKQYNFRSNLEADVTERLKVGLSLAGRQESRKFPTVSAGDIFRSIYRAYPTVNAFYPNGLPSRGIEGTNPAVIATDKGGTVDNPKQVFNGILRASYKLPWVEGLSVDGFLSVDKSMNFSKNFSVPYVLYDYIQSEDKYKESIVGGNNNKATLTESHTNESLITNNIKLNFERKFGAHSINAFVGYEQSKGHLEYFDAQRFNYLSTKLPELSQGGSAATDYLNSGYSTNYTRRSIISRVAYNFSEKYLFEGQLRADGSSIFPEGKKWGYFPSVSAGWRVSKEDWFADQIGFFDDLKIRASYGTLGNDNVKGFQYYDNYTLVGNGFVALLDDKSQIEPNVKLAKLANPAITWEVSKKLDIGLNAQFLKNFTIEAIYFQQKRSDILTERNASIPAISGIVNPYKESSSTPLVPSENIGKVNSSGVEGTFTYQKSGDFSWGASGNITYAKSKIIFIDEASGTLDYQRQTGRPLGTYLLYNAIGLNRSTEDLAGSPQAKGAQIGDLIYEDFNNDGKISADDMYRTKYGNIPQITYGFNLNAAYKNFDASILFAGQAKVSQYVLPESGTVGNFYSTWADNRFHAIGNLQGTYPKVSDRASSAVSGGQYNNTFWLNDASFLRLKNVEIGYSLSSDVLSRLKLGGLRFYANGFNLLTFTKVKDYDPEGNSGSGQFYPQQRIINFGANLKF
ncbi:SusC/RagA family TonB-linked outer membrane protein [Sphingobacterium faecium NBRC 15299]|uniref:SusC/RagA family TonB-linked outer membrane protein n=1 Tax=Sphingobacterium faecium TaxID=34087 RepID=UPI000D39580C|nr:TonB-dependent receptor [Sphingobacterium faecium]PTX11764.1 TonB-linked SusC/RagA family outer membrane protein [Sphingobacterium faecium]GEM63451.1 SusC/RagA family TonB-linked outer membrane protein [Sphingobacterium faecium NBRC 15299]